MIFIEDDFSAFFIYFFQFDSFNFFFVMDSTLLSFELCNLDCSFGDSVYSFEWNAYFGMEKNKSGERGERRIYCGPYARSEPKVVRIV